MACRCDSGRLANTLRRRYNDRIKAHFTTTTTTIASTSTNTTTTTTANIATVGGKAARVGLKRGGSPPPPPPPRPSPGTQLHLPNTRPERQLHTRPGIAAAPSGTPDATTTSLKANKINGIASFQAGHYRCSMMPALPHAFLAPSATTPPPSPHSARSLTMKPVPLTHPLSLTQTSPTQPSPTYTAYQQSLHPSSTFTHPATVTSSLPYFPRHTRALGNPSAELQHEGRQEGSQPVDARRSTSDALPTSPKPNYAFP
ncbi:hypothetical protein E2C01_040123 [Portunus trituberculatus]|uniref:Uncharacterized protein n=1 Tax=Portunus trituberculatus TaxID=210409 RepID=A0A5B7FMS0_PORTR|nr:hypothetical protein [Portunus trituberculatus]